MTDESTLLLEKIYISSKTSIDALSELSRQCRRTDFEHCLKKRQGVYFDIASDAGLQLKKRDRIPEEENPWHRLGFMTSLKLEAFADRSVNHLSKILIDGCVGGVNEMLGLLHSLHTAEKACTELAELLIEAEQDTIVILRRFL